MAEGLLSLSWNNHSATFCHALASLRTKERYADVTLSCEGKFYSVHKLVLSTCSEYFENIFEQTPCKHPIIVLSNIQQIELEAILSYMYDGAVTVSQTNLPRLIKVAELLHIKGLAVPDEPPKSSIDHIHRSQSQDSNSGRNSPPPPTRSSNSSNETSEGPRPKRIRRETDLSQDNPIENPGSVSDTQHQDNSEEFMPEEKYDPGSGTIAEADSESQMLVSSQDSNCEDYIKKEVTETPRGSESSVPDPGVIYDGGGLSDLHEGDSIQALKHTQPPGGQSLLRQESYSEELNTTVAGPSDMQSWFGGEPLSSMSASKANLAPDNQFFGFSSPQQTQKRVVVNGSNMKEASQGHTEVPQNATNTTGQENIYQCPYCPLQLLESYYKDHVEAHNTEKPFCCEFCLFRTSQKASLKTHLRIHTGEKPYLCHLCPLSFSVKCNLKTHIRTHTGEKPFVCPHCPYRCAHKSDLNKHVVRHWS